jgi:hypothetical protein
MSYLLLEVESDDPGGASLAPRTSTERRRRIEFYERNGGTVVTQSPGLELPSFDGSPDYFMKLIWHPLASIAFSNGPQSLSIDVRQLLIRGYGCDEREADHWMKRNERVLSS